MGETNQPAPGNSKALRLALIGGTAALAVIAAIVVVRLRSQPVGRSDGVTRVETLDGVLCRHLNRVADNKRSGFLYFSIHPSFKRDGLRHARVEVEFLARRPGHFRLQFDGMEGDNRRKYLSVLPDGAKAVVRFGPRQSYARIPTTGTWTVATFHITNAVFQNGQNGNADFRLEPLPPEIYVRRVTVTREQSPAPAPAAP